MKKFNDNNPVSPDIKATKMPAKNELGQTVTEVMSGRHPKSHFETEHMHVRHTASGHFVVTHHRQLKPKFSHLRHMSGEYQAPEDSVIGEDHPSYEHIKSLYHGGSVGLSGEANEGASKSKSSAAQGSGNAEMYSHQNAKSKKLGGV